MNFVFGEDTKIHKFSYFYSGEGQLDYNDTITDLSPGMIVYSSPGNWIQLTSSKHNPLCFYSVMFDYALVKWEDENVRCFYIGQRERKLQFDTVMHVKQRSILLGMIQQMHAYWSKKAIGYEWKVKLGFIEMLDELKNQQNATQGEDSSLDAVNKAIAYINLSYRDPIDRQLLADLASISLSHFSLIFKKYTGTSPMLYVTKVRMDKAKEYLRESRKTIGEIACAVGYPDPLYFSRVFAKETGLSPREYRDR
jgi:YesN/AraC family two-component response regulator